MADFVTLSCPSCGHKLQITEDIDRFVCMACGNEHIVIRSGGIVSAKIADEIKGVKVGVDKTASELAIVRLKKEIEDLEQCLAEYEYKLRVSKPGNWQRTYGIYASIFTAIGLFWTIGFIISGWYEGVGWAVGCTFIPLVIAIICFSGQKSSEDEYRKCYNEIQAKKLPIITKIKEKNIELRKHQEIVSKLD